MNKLALCLLMLAAPLCAKEKRDMEWKGAFSPVTEPAHMVAKTQEEWEALWKRIDKPAPAADLKKFFAVAVFLGTEPTGGYGVSFEAKKNTVRYTIKKPEGMAIQALTQPYAVRLFPKHRGEIVVLPAGD